MLAAFATPAHAQDAADLVLRLDRLENENRRLNGQVDELQFQLKRVEDQLKRFQLDADSRFRDLEGGRGGAPRPQQQGTAPQAPLNQGQPVVPNQPAQTPSGRRSDAFDPNQGTNSPGAPRPLGASPGSAPLPLGGGVATAPGVPLPGGNLPSGALSSGGGDINAPLDVTGRRPPPVDDLPTPRDANSSFAYGKSLIDRGDFEASEGAFRDFLRAYPRDRRVAEATFWLGESYLRRTRYREAAEQFLTVTSKYSSAARAPEAMLKLGISLRGIGANQEACGTFDQVTKKYPNASPAIRQAVGREKGRAQC
jgi:tol-pal system protein YbgF